MNAESSLRFPEEFTRDKREVYLDGEAYFQVAKDSLKPFLVHVDKYCSGYWARVSMSVPIPVIRHGTRLSWRVR